MNQRQSRVQIIIKNKLKYTLSLIDKIGSVIGYEELTKDCDIYIPRSVEVNGEEFVITKISSRSFSSLQIKSIEFAQDSEVETIEDYAFRDSQIGSIAFPASISNLEAKWSFGTSIKDISVKPGNPNFMFVNNLLLLGKSDKESSDYDVVAFARKDVKKIEIPSFVKQIGQSAFESSIIESIAIPAGCEKIGESAFYKCGELRSAEFPPDSKLQTIGVCAFSCTRLEHVFIPPCVTEIYRGAFEFSKLKEVQFSPDSKLRVIGEEAFSNTKIEIVRIPPHVTKICKRSFAECHNLQEVVIPPDSELQTIENHAFNETQISSLHIPAAVANLEVGWCGGALCLDEITVDQSNKSFAKCSDFLVGKSDIQKDIFDVLVFAARNANLAQIPDHLKIIGPFAFSACLLIRVELHEQVTRIEKSAFFDCVFLTHVCIPQNSQLQVIGKRAFEYSAIECFYIPPKVSCFFVNAFRDCNQLVIVEIDENSNLEEIKYPRISGSESYIIMVPMKLRNLFKNNGN